MKKSDFRNIFLNIAVPIMQASEPGETPSVQVTDDIKLTVWDRHEVELSMEGTLLQLIHGLEEKYKGLYAKDIFYENRALYLYDLMQGKGAEEIDKKMSTSLYDQIASA